MLNNRPPFSFWESLAWRCSHTLHFFILQKITNTKLVFIDSASRPNYKFGKLDLLLHNISRIYFDILGQHVLFKLLKQHYRKKYVLPIKLNK